MFKNNKIPVPTEARVFKYFMVGWARLFLPTFPPKMVGNQKPLPAPYNKFIIPEKL
jgi:hypothetical protein